MNQRRLLVMRHAKAESFAASDHDRELMPRGVADARAAGRWTAEQGILPDYVVVSTAARTRQTWTAFAAGSGADAAVVNDRALYSAGTEGALEIIRNIPAHTQTAMLVGHNPTMEVLVHLLDDGGAEAAVFAELSGGYPTSAITVLSVPGDWSALDVGSARVTKFHVGRGSDG